MHRRLVLVVAAFLGVTLAGCADAPSSPDQGLQDAVDQGVAADVPVWNLGDWWTYRMPSGTSSFVVTAVEGAEYIIDSNEKSVAYYDAKYDISFVGKIRQSDLAGAQGSQRVAMFEWPLTDQKVWQTTWDGERLDMKASAMGLNQFHVMGHRASDDAMTVEYHYNAAKKWFEYIVFYDPDNGTEAFRMDLTDSGVAFQGTTYRYGFGEVRHHQADAGQSPIFYQPLEAEWNELGVTVRLDCGGAAGGTVGVGISSPEHAEQSALPMLPVVNDAEHWRSIMCHDKQQLAESFVLSNSGGSWEIGLLAGAPDAIAMLVIEERALQATPFPG